MMRPGDRKGKPRERFAAPEKNGRRIRCWIVVGAAAVSLCASGAETQLEDRRASGSGPGHIIRVGMEVHWGKLQRPAAFFDHDAHTRELKGQECDLCHRLQERRQEKDIRIYGFPKDKVPAEREALMDGYHAACTGCHQERLGQGRAAGPVTCGQCHPVAPALGKTWAAVRFDYAIHHKHRDAAESKCETCHHVYDETQKKLVYKKNAETSCRDCHRSADEENRRSFRHVAHAQCLDCHMKRQKENQKGGPQTCDGCHGGLPRATPAEIAGLPRLFREQKDTMELKVEGGRTKAVVFNHKDHETRVAFCGDCHHFTHEKCSSCHTLTGSPDGAGINLADAFHLSRSVLSCVGCHERRTETPACGGCHQFQAKGVSEGSCPICHSGPPKPTMAKSPEGFLAGLSEDQFPEKVEIKILEREYEPAHMPHLKIVRALMATAENKKLADRFHGERGAICLGCHHRVQWDPETKLTGCKGCHGTVPDNRSLGRPSLVGAYHQQCMGCHETMKVKAMGCADCHKEKAIAAPMEIRKSRGASREGENPLRSRD
jgi:hypothetical protein